MVVCACKIQASVKLTSLFDVHFCRYLQAQKKPGSKSCPAQYSPDGYEGFQGENTSSLYDKILGLDVLHLVIFFFKINFSKRMGQ